MDLNIEELNDNWIKVHDRYLRKSYISAVNITEERSRAGDSLFINFYINIYCDQQCYVFPVYDRVSAKSSAEKLVKILNVKIERNDK